MGWWRARATAVLAAVLWLLAAAAAGDADAGDLERAFPIIEPDYGHTKLRLSKEGLEAIQRIKTPIAAVSVIGPYRSGKSFLLNQLLSLSCDKGFGVGHMRDTKTKGIWVWGTPIEVDIDGSIVSVLYLDTEGFESVGKSNVYDDSNKCIKFFAYGRIFALATVLSSVLIYNLPETIREADISRLSFAVEIAEEFYGRYLHFRKKENLFSRWLTKHSNGCLTTMINQIRDSLAVMGDNSTTFSLPQILEALNKGEIPSTGSLVEVFNKAIVERCLKLYNERMGRAGLPVSMDKLQQFHDVAKDEARSLFNKQHFGKHHAAQSISKLDEEIKKVFRNFGQANEYQSSKLCEARFSECEDKMEHLQVLKLPSMAKFDAGFLLCNQSFEMGCVGPAKESYQRRMSKMLARSRALFIKDYNNKLFNWLVIFSLVMVVIGRFVVKFFLLEIAAWVMFDFLETYTRLFWSSESLYYNPV
ncbi:guanylate-binding protein 3-like [Panicum miliaceum]|uniref:Guanylate-binding protein 3-like n=1 Tax=Panicum miliaceum TaxID=4540 RepID=A0A3L6TBF8_PANMI|nr:guanylate-binding protein 3-like [Panicum miliaceum]